MTRRSLVVSLFVLVAAASSPSVRAQELTTDAERSWRELRGSEDVKRKLLAERWYSAVRQQDWSDATGKFKTSAKYVAHDPQLAWVKLRVIQGAGEKRIVKDVQIPLEKLSIACQARVRQIAKLSDKMTEAIEAEKKAAEDEEAGGERSAGGRGEIASDPRGEMAADPRGGRGEMEGGLAGMDAEQVTAERRSPPGRGGREVIGAEEPPVTNDGPPLPAVMPRLPQAAAAADARPAVTAAGAPAETAVTESAPAEEAWRTSYDTFLSNIKFLRTRNGIDFDWGELQALKAAYDHLVQLKMSGVVEEAGLAEVNQKLADAGEVHWEGTLTSTGDESGDWTAALGLPPLPSPLRIRFILDPEADASPWQNLAAGERVRFIGRFQTLDEETCFTVAVRLAGDPRGRGAAAPEPAPAAAPTR
jgi:hypothetical protein